MDGPDAEVGAGLLGALVGDEGGHRDEPVGAGAVSPGDLERGGVHLRGAREVPGVGDPVEVARVEDDEAAGGVEQVDGAHLVGVDVAHRGGEHGGDAGRVGEGEQARGVRPASGSALGAAVEDDLDGEPVAGQHGLPRGEQVAGAVAPAREGRAPDVGVGAEQHEQPTGARGSSPASPASPDQRAMRSGVVTGTPRSPRRWVCVTRRHRAAHPAPGATPAT